MTEPKRLLDSASPEVRALLRAGAPSRSMSHDERVRSRKRLAGALTGVVVAGGLSWIPGAALGAGLGLIVGVGTLVAPSWSSVDPPLSTPAPVMGSGSALPEKQAPPPPIQAPVVQEPGPSARPVAVAPSATVTASSSEDPLAEEVALLDRARASLSGNPGEALRLTGEHAARFPRGKMSVEREMVAIDALRRLGRTSEARSRADALLSRPGGSLYEERIRNMF